MYKARRMNLDHYRAPAARPVFIAPPIHAETPSKWKAYLAATVAGLAMVGIAYLVLSTL